LDVPVIDGLNDRERRPWIMAALMMAPIEIARLHASGDGLAIDAEIDQPAVVGRARSAFAFIAEGTGGNTREAGLHGDDEQVKHEPNVVAQALRRSIGYIDRRRGSA